MSTLKVDGIRSNSASSDAITLASDGTCTAKITNNLSNRNLIINGAMQIAQRGTSATSATNGYHTVDRWGQSNGGLDNAATMAQVDVASGTTPYTLGFRKAYKITNGDQTSVGNGDYYRIYQFVEAQNMANSGWNYTSTSSDITVSCWVKSSVAQNFYIELRTQDGTQQAYVWETGTLTAGQWTKITKTITGNSNIQIDNDNSHGPCLFFHLFNGTDMTGTMTLNQWAAYNTAVRTPDMTSTWYDTNDSTFELTGVQLEVGSVATDFEHRSYGDELAKCQRYCYEHLISGSNAYASIMLGCYYMSSRIYGSFRFPVTMRAAPTMVCTDATDAFVAYRDGNADNVNEFHIDSANNVGPNGAEILNDSDASGTAGQVCFIRRKDTNTTTFRFEAEL